ncbi:hypothetical protein GCM10010912_48720 [Paenibacillus albidus]|uniref:Uncharacterized protein n=1 Tax=Paenibacillus albidus TaxID=2041023 RepID=A0A917CVE8_9BACL|nr:hypothetical protein GCM10010912_48720 [Paenibacillus albidus]
MPHSFSAHMITTLKAFISGYEGLFFGQLRNQSRVLYEGQVVFEMLTNIYYFIYFFFNNS